MPSGVPKDGSRNAGWANLKVGWAHNWKPGAGPASGIPASGPGLHGAAQHLPKAPAFTTENQPMPEAKSAGHEVRAAFRAKLAERLDKVVAVYDRALADDDVRPGLVAAKQISAELWDPKQEISGPDGGAIPTALTIEFVRPRERRDED